MAIGLVVMDLNVNTKMDECTILANLVSLIGNLFDPNDPAYYN